MRDPASRADTSHLERWRQTWHALQVEKVPRWTLYFLGILVFGGTVVYNLEHSTNEGFKTLGDGFWWALVTLTTIGYGDRYPLTTAGRLVAGVVILLGMGMVGVATAKIASFLVERRIKEGRGLSEAHGLRNHFVIVGWKPDIHLLVRDILAAHPDVGAEKVVLVNTAGQDLNDGLRRDFRGLKYLHGDVIDPLILQRALIAQAAKVFVLADATGGRSDQEVDARTVMALMNIENLAPSVYTYAEVLDTQYVDYLRLARCDEIILSREYGRFMLVSASASAGISQALLALMDIASGGGLASEPIPPEFVGRTFADLARHMKAAGGKLLVGLLENTGQSLTIKKSALREAQKTANVATLVENLRRVREMNANNPILNPGDEHVIAQHARALVLPRAPAARSGEGQ
jgi:voltage-gated potassium channel